MNRVIKFFKKHIVGIGFTIGSIIFVLLLHRVHVFDYLELKTVDFAFRMRGPLSGWNAKDPIPKESELFEDLNGNGKFDEGEPFNDLGNDIWDKDEPFEDENGNGKRDEGEPFKDVGNGKWDKGLDVVIIDIDDESWRLVPWTWQYPREVWALVLRNLYRAGAKVVVFDIQFDSPDRQSEYLKEISQELGQRGLSELVPAHGDSVFSQAIQEAQDAGMSVILASKIVNEPTSIPPQYVAYPNSILLSADPVTGLVSEDQDIDGSIRQYYIYYPMAHEPGKWYLTLAMKAIKEYRNFPDDFVLTGDMQKGEIQFGTEIIPTYGEEPSFMINYYGPPSGAKLQGNKAWKTFNRYPLSNVIDVIDVDLKNEDEDTNWMEFFMEDSPLYGLIGESPFKNKIVLIGISVEVIHDIKRTPYYSYAGQQQLMPGVEVHANAIQTILDRNYISVLGSEIGWSNKSYFSHTLLITVFSFLTFVFLLLMNPIFAGLSIILVVLVFLNFALGAFTADFLWLLKSLLHNILPESWINRMGDWIFINTPGIGESKIIPVVAPIFGLFFTYTSNVLYRFIVEQKDKRFLKNTFGTYISPELIDQMYESKQQPKLGGDEGERTAFFTDIQSFSTFSEKLSATKLVELLNEYLTSMTDILMENRGTLDKYEGDAILAFYGAPVPVEKHAYYACLTAVLMQVELEKLREKWKSEDDKWPEIVHNMRVRIGIATGSIVTGNMGSINRMDYTMMGDVVNIAARLESSAKQYGIYNQVSNTTYETVKDDFIWRHLDYVVLVGKKEPIDVYELIAETGKTNTEEINLLEAFHEARELYLSQKWDAAIEAFGVSDKLEDMFPGRFTNPSQVYIKRCDHFKANPPGDDWDGSWTLTKK